MKVLVTGATGFLGTALMARLRRDGHQVTGVARSGGDAQLDITDAAACRTLLAQGGFGAVVHAAALAHVRPGRVRAAEVQAINVGGAANVAAAAAAEGVAVFVLVSSVTVYGDTELPVPVTEDHPRSATDLYGVSKVRAEDACAAALPHRALVILRPATMYARDWLFNIRKRVAAPGIGRFAYFTLDPATPRYSLCSRDNMVTAVVRAVSGSLAPGAYNVADDAVYRQRDILRAVESVEGRRPHIPVPRLLPLAAWRLAPPGPARERARRRYWKFCGPNVYSSSRIQAAGVPMPPGLLTMELEPLR